MRFFNRRGLDRFDNESLSVSIEIYKPVVDRIKKSLISSNIEEGGKFIGTIIENNKQINVSIFSYIDAGPRVSNSQTHIVPDGRHQEYLFRIIEGYDPSVEHVGSWHSHHCNGYPDLSSGDIQGYKHNVNDRNYNLNWFFVLLITNVNKFDMDAKYYLFQRGKDDYIKLDNTAISIVDHQYQYEGVLKAAEESTSIHRYQKKQTLQTSFCSLNEMTLANFMMDIRSTDKKWIENNFSNFYLIRNKQNNSVYWKISIHLSKNDKAHIIYAYPKNTEEEEKKATLYFYYKSNEIKQLIIDLDENRFLNILNFISQVKEYCINSHEGYV